jgi:branched-chain amino acid transport system substrate-binding protein
VEPLRLPHRPQLDAGRARRAATLKDENINIATLRQDYAFGKDGIASLKEALGAVGSKAKIVHEEYAPQTTTDFTAAGQRLFDALKDKPGRRIVAVVWAGAHPLPKLMDLKPERYKIEIAPGGNILPVMAGWKQFPGLEGAIYYYWGFPQEPGERLAGRRVQEEEQRRAAGLLRRRRHGRAHGGGRGGQEGRIDRHRRSLIARDGGHELHTPKGKMTFRKEGPQRCRRCTSGA